MGIEKVCKNCYFQPLCDMYKSKMVGTAPHNEASCDFFKDKTLVKEVPYTCKECGFSQSLSSQVGGKTYMKWFCCRGGRTSLVDPNGFCSYGSKGKESKASGYNRCDSCAHNPVCDHNKNGFESCGHYLGYFI